jgi:predicted TIM-barrel fold metal-dependent hydrolase
VARDRLVRLVPLVLALVSSACTRIPASAPAHDARVDPELAQVIASIKSFDNHAHPVRSVAFGEAPDTEYDALPVENLEAAADPVRMRADAPETVAARQALFPEGKAVALRQHGAGYAAWVLDQLGIETMVANRVVMGTSLSAPGLSAPRFLWVPYADALLFPLDGHMGNDAMIHNSDQKAFFRLEEKLLRRYFSEAGVSGRPDTLDEYLEKVVRATIDRHQRDGAIAEKFEIAYLRPYDIGNPTRAAAEQAWQGRGDYKALQDFIFRFIATECGRRGMAVHIHSGAGSGSYFNVGGTNPLLLEPLFNDPEFRASGPSLHQTNFVLLHGGWPFSRELTALLTKPNVYTDFSMQGLVLGPSELAQVLRSWLEYVPEKVLFGTDAYPYSDQMGWEESAYISSQTGRTALGIALTGMLHDGEITGGRAAELARMVLRGNAHKLYGLKP